MGCNRPPIPEGLFIYQRRRMTIIPNAVSLYEVKFVEAYGFRLRADALMPLKEKMEIPPGMTKQLWLTIDSRGQQDCDFNDERDKVHA